LPAGCSFDGDYLFGWHPVQRRVFLHAAEPDADAPGQFGHAARDIDGGGRAALLVRSFTITEGPDGVARLPYWADRADHVARTPLAEISRPAANNNSRTRARITPPESTAAEWLTFMESFAQ
jgi:hypothetical protein